VRNAIIVGLVLAISATAWADWRPGDDHKMHWPQLPDFQGWDVNATNPKILADDWRCSQSGDVTDVHFWGSWQGNLVGEIENIHLSIHKDIPAAGPNDFSRPGDLLGEWDISPTDTRVTIVRMPTSPQGWYDPNTGVWTPNDHTLWYQYNIVGLGAAGEDLVFQNVGEIYWLDITFDVLPMEIPGPGPNDPPEIIQPLWGWKTADMLAYPDGTPTQANHFQDDAVWADLGGGAALVWNPLEDQEGVSFDLAFVITPEPATMTVMGLGAIAVLVRRRKRRS